MEIQVAKETLGPIASKTRTSKMAQGIRTQLDLLAELLSSIERRCATDVSCTGGQDKRLAPVLRDIKAELEELLDLVDRLEGPKGGPSPNIFRRAKLVLSGFEKDLKDRGERLGRIINTLQMYLAEWTIRYDQRSQLRKLLATSSTDFISKKLDGTLEWIWAHELFEKWASLASSSAAAAVALTHGPNDRVLIIHGVKGSGKSVLAASVVCGLREKLATTLFFSFWASHGRETRIEAMLRALLSQLLGALPDDTQFKFIPRLLDRMKDLKDPEFLVEQLCAVAQEEHASDVFCVLDGIDESADDWNGVDNESPLACLGKLVSAIPKLRLLLVGRQSSLRSAMQRWPVHLELTRELVHADLQRFISAELDNCPNIPNDDMRELIHKELDAKSTVMFLWVKLLFRGLRSCFSPNEMKYTLGRIPEELDREYSRLLSMLMTRLQGHSTDPSAGMIRARGLLEIIVGASRPLSFIELRLAYAFSHASDDSDSGYIDNLVSEEGIIDSCGDFSTVRDGLICLGHTSMREFFLRPATRWTSHDGSISFFQLDVAKAHTTLALACLRYLRHVNWEERGHDNTSYWTNTLAGQYPMLCYASTFGTSHLLDSDLSPQDATAAGLEFLSSGKFTAWMDFATSEPASNSLLSPTPLYFLEDATHFWAMCATHETFESTDQQFPMATHSIMSSSGTTVPNRAPAATSYSMEPHERAGADVQGSENHDIRLLLNFSHQIRHMDLATKFSQVVQQKPLSRQLATMTNLLMSPSDLLFHTLERYMNTASYLCLMILGATFEFASGDSEPQALRLYTQALSRVEGQGGLREALALARLGDFGTRHETREEHFRGVMAILEPARDHPLMDLAWASIAVGRSHSLFSLGRLDEATLVARQAEDAVLKHTANTTPQAQRNGMRQWCHSQWYNSRFVIKTRNMILINIGVSYDEEGSFEDVDRVLGHLAQDVPALKSVSTFNALYCMFIVCKAKFRLADSDEAHRSDMLDAATSIFKTANDFARDENAGDDPEYDGIELSFARSKLVFGLHDAEKTTKKRKKLTPTCSFNSKA